MPQKGIVDPAIVRQINHLRTFYKYHEFDDNPLSPEAVGALLVHLMDKEERMERQPSFGQVATHLCNYVYDLRDPAKLKQVATTALAAIHQRGEIASDTEVRVNLRHGQLAKVKAGQPLAVTPLQVIALAVDLEVPVEALFTDYANRPEDLKKLLNGAAVASTVAPVLDAARVAEEPPRPVSELEATPVPDEVSETPEEVIVVTDIPTSGSAESLTPQTKVVDGRQVAAHIRAFAKQAKLSLTDLLATVGITNQRHLEGVELGRESPFTKNQLAHLATKLGVTVEALESGDGLKAPKPRQRSSETALVPIGAKALLLPPVSPERRQEYFRERCLQRNIEPAEGRSLGELLEAARQVDSVDWCDIWHTVTKDGAAFRQNLDRVAAMAKPWGDVMRATFLEELHRRFFPPADT